MRGLFFLLALILVSCGRFYAKPSCEERIFVQPEIFGPPLNKDVPYYFSYLPQGELPRSSQERLARLVYKALLSEHPVRILVWKGEFTKELVETATRRAVEYIFVVEGIRTLSPSPSLPHIEDPLPLIRGYVGFDLRLYKVPEGYTAWLVSGFVRLCPQGTPEENAVYLLAEKMGEFFKNPESFEGSQKLLSFEIKRPIVIKEPQKETAEEDEDEEEEEF